MKIEMYSSPSLSLICSSFQFTIRHLIVRHDVVFLFFFLLRFSFSSSFFLQRIIGLLI